ncbi:FAD:protein FMN transferase, partial [bacterium]
IEKKFSMHNPESPVYDFNMNNISITDNEITNLVKTSQIISEKSKGAFDITIAPVIRLWGFYESAPRVPKEEEIAETLKKTGYKNLVILNNTLIKMKEQVQIDLGSIAKGYAVSEAVKVIKNAGIRSALIDAGGDIYALGRPGEKYWKVGVRNPRGEGIIGVLELADTAVVTSGDYERAFEKDGKRYHHIIDPDTGYPAQGLSSVTIVSPDPTLADAYATAVFVLGKDKGMKFVEALQFTEALLITNKGKKLYSKGLKNIYKDIEEK